MDSFQNRGHIVVSWVVLQWVPSSQRRPFIVVHSRGEEASGVLAAAPDRFWAGLYVGHVCGVGCAGVRRGIEQGRRHGDEHHQSRDNMAAESVSLHLLCCL